MRVAVKMAKGRLTPMGVEGKACGTVGQVGQVLVAYLATKSTIILPIVVNSMLALAAVYQAEVVRYARCSVPDTHVVKVHAHLVVSVRKKRGVLFERACTP